MRLSKVIICLLLVFPGFVHLNAGEILPPQVAEPLVPFVEVKPKDAKRTPGNPAVRVYFRPPTRYDPTSKMRYRVLVIFGGRNCSGEREAAGIQGGLQFDQWADQRNIFLVAPGFRDDEYWKPEKWSGRVLREALALIKKKYRIDDRNLMFYGYSAGAQASNLFSFWQPERTRAWVSHAGGVFFKPDPKMRRIAALVTCGDADTARYVISRRFVEECRRLEINVVFKSYLNLTHEVSLESAIYAQNFLAYYNWLYREDLDPSRRNPKPIREPVKYIGDDLEGVYWPADAKQAKRIALDERVYFPNELLANCWGVPARIWKNMQARGNPETPDSPLEE